MWPSIRILEHATSDLSPILGENNCDTRVYLYTHRVACRHSPAFLYLSSELSHSDQEYHLLSVTNFLVSYLMPSIDHLLWVFLGSALAMREPELELKRRSRDAHATTGTPALLLATRTLPHYLCVPRHLYCTSLRSRAREPEPNAPEAFFFVAHDHYRLKPWECTAISNSRRSTCNRSPIQTFTHSRSLLPSVQKYQAMANWVSAQRPTC